MCTIVTSVYLVCRPVLEKKNMMCVIFIDLEVVVFLCIFFVGVSLLKGRVLRYITFLR